MLLAPLLAFLLILLALPGPLAAQGAFETLETESCAPLSLLTPNDPAPCSEVRLDQGEPLGPPREGEPESVSTSSETPREHAPLIKDDRLRILLASGIVGGAALGGFLNAYQETPRHSFHVTYEGWFGPHTYAGGADKAAHFVEYTILSKELANIYEVMGFSRTASIALGFGTAFTSGLMNEIGDGFNPYGFSPEDLTMDTLGAGAAALVKLTRTEDLFSFRTGLLLPLAGSKTCCQDPGLGRDYSNEIYTADLHLAGVFDRLHLKVGPLRYLMFSATYGVKGYPSGTPSLRERQIGFEIGLDFEVILDDLHVKRDTWWGYGLHIVFDNFRFPFTAVGFRYDLNHDKWTGPDNGNGFAAR
jgi:hypothetical protein